MRAARALSIHQTVNNLTLHIQHLDHHMAVPGEREAIEVDPLNGFG